jgi:HEAT repeat protein
VEVTAAVRLALARLGDRPMVDAYLARLNDDDPAVRAGALRDLPYVDDRGLVQQVLPLLSDERDAENTGPGGYRLMIRVCDVAVQVLDDYCGHPFPFQVRLGKLYSDDELRSAITAAQRCRP